MPWALCTTGSPTLSSDKSLISASTSLTCSCFLRLRVVTPAANNSVSVTKSMPASNQWKPEFKAAVAMPIFSSLARNSCRSSKAGGLTPLARKKSSKLSRRPALSARIKTRLAVFRMCACSLPKGSSAPRTTVRSGNGWANVLSALVSVPSGATCLSANWACW